MAEETTGVESEQDPTTTTTQSEDGIDWDAIYKSPRFQSVVADYKKRAKAAETALAQKQQAESDAEQGLLKEQKRYQELYEKEQARTAALDSELKTLRQAALDDRKRASLLDQARAHEPPFSAQALQDVTVFVDLAKLEIEDDGKVRGVEQAIRELAKAKPYMLESRRQDPGSPSDQKPAAPGSPEAARKDFERMVRSRIMR